MWQALLWDHDGVLVDTERLYLQATREALATVGAQLSDAEYRHCLLVTGVGAWHLAIERGCSTEQIAALKQQRDARYRELLLGEEVELPGVSALLTALRGRVRMAIVTSSQRPHFDAIHRRTTIPSHFELILTREDYHASKPDPEPYLTAVARLDVPAARCLVIEDSERGLRAAKAAGLSCWVIPTDLTRDSDFQHADRRFEHLDDLHHALLESTAP